MVTIDELAAATGTTSRRIRSLQTLGLLPHPVLRGRTGLYGPTHRARLDVVRRLQRRGFSLESIGALLRAHERGQSLGELLGMDPPCRATEADDASGADTAELYGFAELQLGAPRGRSGRGRPLLSLVPSTLWAWEEGAAS